MTADVQTELLKQAERNFTSDFTIVKNLEGSYALVVKELIATPNNVFPTVHFFVWDEHRKELIYRDVLPQGEVKWLNNYEIFCESKAGRFNEQEKGKKYVYDVRSNQTKEVGK
jgi:hypothetical protein